MSTGNNFLPLLDYLNTKHDRKKHKDSWDDQSARRTASTADSDTSYRSLKTGNPDLDSGYTDLTDYGCSKEFHETDTEDENDKRPAVKQSDARREHGQRVLENGSVMFQRKVYPSTRVHLPEDLTFCGPVLPDQIQRDLDFRRTACNYPLVTDYRNASGLDRVDVDYDKAYDPVGLGKIGKLGTVQQEHMSEVFQQSNDITIVPKDPFQTFIPWSVQWYPDVSRVDVDIGSGILPGQIANFIINQELRSTRKLTPVMIHAGMGIGKTAVLIELFRRWPEQTTRKVVSFHDAEFISSRNGSRIPCDRITSFAGICPEKIDRQESCYPTLIIVDECQFSDPDTYLKFIDECQKNYCKPIFAGIPMDLACRTWEGMDSITRSDHRIMVRMHGKCQICSDVTADLSAQLRQRPRRMFFDELKPKGQWITACTNCSYRYFPYCLVSQRGAPGVDNNNLVN